MSILRAAIAPHPPIIVPAIGRGEEKKISKTTASYREAMRFLAEIKPDTVIISTPHSVMYSDYFHISPGRSAKGDFGQFHRSDVGVSVSYDDELIQAIEKIAGEMRFPAGTLGEVDKALDHGVMIPLLFLNEVYKDYRIVRIGLSGLSLADHYAMGQLIQKAVNELSRKAVYIASGDLSHKLLEDGPYGFSKEGPEYDKALMEIMASSDFGKLLEFDPAFLEKAAECGHGSFTMMAGAFDGRKIKSRVLSHEGSFGVGYGLATLEDLGEDPDRFFLDEWREKEKARLEKKRSSEDTYVRLARYVVERHTKKGERPSLAEVKEFLSKGSKLTDRENEELFESRAGAFVSIHENGLLRGCIGTISPTEQCLAEEIIQNAISSSSDDPRFSPVREEELTYLSISVDVLGKAEEVKSMDMLDPKRYGVIVSKRFRRGLLLPDLEGVDTALEQVEIAASKANLSPDEKGLKIERFEVVRHE
jgi:AmmeMemoRadiSam system protein A/AmmeMemoRadiSam system protein B